jgi:hypothetical protein
MKNHKKFFSLLAGEASNKINRAEKPSAVATWAINVYFLLREIDIFASKASPAQDRKQTRARFDS